MSRSSGAQPVRTAILAGSGIYEMTGLEQATEYTPETPFGEPSAPILVGRLGERKAAFLARHGKGHVLLPSEINYRANIFALKSLGVERVLSASAVGSMRAEIRPRDVVLVDQFIDRTAHRRATFFGDGIAAHVGLADPVCPVTRGVLRDAARRCDARAHDGGTYVCIEGPAFSTRAESNLFRSWGADVVGMTNMQEAKLCREAEMCYATLALVTDFDCWHDDEEDVSVGALLGHLQANQALAARLLRDAIVSLPDERTCGCAVALEDAIITSRDAISSEVYRRLGPILSRYLDDPS